MKIEHFKTKVLEHINKTRNKSETTKLVQAAERHEEKTKRNTVKTDTGMGFPYLTR